jgi:hypothetical protein
MCMMALLLYIHKNALLLFHSRLGVHSKHALLLYILLFYASFAVITLYVMYDVFENCSVM